MPQLIIDDTSLYYELHGNGPPLMLIAGLASDSQSWQPVVPPLARHFTLILPDNRGAGRSPLRSELTVGRMADDCLALAAHLGFERVHLLGHSMGGMVAMESALRSPRMVASLLLVASAPCNSPRNNLLLADWAAARDSGANGEAWFRSLFYWLFTERFFDNRPQVEEAITVLSGSPYPQSAQAFREQVRAIASYDATGTLGRITAPTCVIAGELDQLMPVATSVALAKQIPGARLTVIQGAAHSIQTEQPEPLVTAIIEFLRAVNKECR